MLGMSDDEDFDADNSDSDFEYRQTCCYCCGPGFSVSVRTAVDTLPADIFQDLWYLQNLSDNNKLSPVFDVCS